MINQFYGMILLNKYVANTYMTDSVSKTKIIDGDETKENSFILNII